MLELRHVTSINDLTVDEIETVFALARKYLKDLRDPNVAHRIGRSIADAQGSILATLFYEPSTRTSPAPRTPRTWAETVDVYASTCPAPFFTLVEPSHVDAAGRSFVVEGSTVRLQGGPWKGPLKIGVLGALKDAEPDTRANVKHAMKEFTKAGVHFVVANGDLVGDEAGDLPRRAELDEVLHVVGVFAARVGIVLAVNAAKIGRAHV